MYEKNKDSAAFPWNMEPGVNCFDHCLCSNNFHVDFDENIVSLIESVLNSSEEELSQYNIGKKKTLNQRRIDFLVKYYKENSTYKQIAEEYGISPSRVGQEINAGLSCIRKIIRIKLLTD